jgi:hypothetical protein
MGVNLHRDTLALVDLLLLHRRCSHPREWSARQGLTLVHF